MSECTHISIKICSDYVYSYIIILFYSRSMYITITKIRVILRQCIKIDVIYSYFLCYYVLIKSHYSFFFFNIFRLFQFQYGAIKSNEKRLEEILVASFQFQYGAIKS